MAVLVQLGGVALIPPDKPGHGRHVCRPQEFTLFKQGSRDQTQIDSFNCQFDKYFTPWQDHMKVAERPKHQFKVWEEEQLVRKIDHKLRFCLN